MDAHSVVGCIVRPVPGSESNYAVCNFVDYVLYVCLEENGLCRLFGG